MICFCILLVALFATPILPKILGDGLVTFGCNDNMQLFVSDNSGLGCSSYSGNSLSPMSVYGSTFNPAGTFFSDVCTTEFNTIFLTSNSEIFVVGKNTSLSSAPYDTMFPELVIDQSCEQFSITGLSCSGDTVVYTTSGGDIYGFGQNGMDQFGNAMGYTPMPVFIHDNIEQAKISESTLVAVAVGREVGGSKGLMTSGCNTNGLLGIGSSSTGVCSSSLDTEPVEGDRLADVPFPIDSVYGFRDASFVVIASTQQVFGWGLNSVVLATSSRTSPQDLNFQAHAGIQLGSAVLDLSCGFNVADSPFCFAVLKDYLGLTHLFSWGQAAMPADLGRAAVDSLYPREVHLPDAAAGEMPLIVRAGYTQTMVLTTSGNVHVVGEDEFGLFPGMIGVFTRTLYDYANITGIASGNLGKHRVLTAHLENEPYDPYPWTPVDPSPGPIPIGSSKLELFMWGCNRHYQAGTIYPIGDCYPTAPEMISSPQLLDPYVVNFTTVQAICTTANNTVFLVENRVYVMGQGNLLSKGNETVPYDTEMPRFVWDGWSVGFEAYSMNCTADGKDNSIVLFGYDMYGGYKFFVLGESALGAIGTPTGVPMPLSLPTGVSVPRFALTDEVLVVVNDYNDTRVWVMGNNAHELLGQVSRSSADVISSFEQVDDAYLSTLIRFEEMHYTQIEFISANPNVVFVVVSTYDSQMMVGSTEVVGWGSEGGLLMATEGVSEPSPISIPLLDSLSGGVSGPKVLQLLCSEIHCVMLAHEGYSDPAMMMGTPWPVLFSWGTSAADSFILGRNASTYDVPDYSAGFADAIVSISLTSGGATLILLSSGELAAFGYSNYYEFDSMGTPAQWSVWMPITGAEVQLNSMPQRMHHTFITYGVQHTCGGTASGNTSVCSGAGYCESGGYCSCYMGYCGAYCEMPCGCPDYGYGPCSYNGDCVSGGYCQCYFGFEGMACEFNQSFDSKYEFHYWKPLVVEDMQFPHTIGGLEHGRNMSEVAPSPGARIEACTWYHQNEAQVYMGFGISYVDQGWGANREPRNDMWMYDENNETWTWISQGWLGPSSTFMPPNATLPPPRFAAQCWATDSDLYLWGGYRDTMMAGSSEYDFHSDMWHMDTDTKTWKLDAEYVYYSVDCNNTLCAPPARARAAGKVAGSWGDKFYVVFGGVGFDSVMDSEWMYHDSQFCGKDDTWRFSLQTLEWELLYSGAGVGNCWGKQNLTADEPSPGARYGMFSWGISTDFYIFGGHSGGGGMFADLWKLSIDSPVSLWQCLTGCDASHPQGTHDRDDLPYYYDAPIDVYNELYPGYVPDPGYFSLDFLPGARADGCSWSYEYPDHHLYMFSGSNIRGQIVGEILMYSAETNEWGVANGSSTPGYPVQNITLEYPMGRVKPSCWTNFLEVLYVYGGEGEVSDPWPMWAEFADSWNYFRWDQCNVPEWAYGRRDISEVDEVQAADDDEFVRVYEKGSCRVKFRPIDPTVCCDGGGLTAGAIAGIIIGVLFGIVLFLAILIIPFLLVVFLRKKPARASRSVDVGTELDQLEVDDDDPTPAEETVDDEKQKSSSSSSSSSDD